MYKYYISALFAMLLGSQCVHMVYKPLEHFPQLVEEDMARMRLKISEKKKLATVNSNDHDCSTGDKNS